LWFLKSIPFFFGGISLILVCGLGLAVGSRFKKVFLHTCALSLKNPFDKGEPLQMSTAASNLSLWLNRFLHSISGKLILFFLLLSLIPVGIVGFGVYTQARVAIEQRASGELSRLAAIEANRVESFFASRIMDTQVMASNPDIRSLNPEKVSNALQLFAKQWPMYQGLVITGPDGQSIASNSGKKIDQSKNASFQKAIKGNIAVTDPFVSALTGDLIIAAFVPVKDDQGNVVATASTSITTKDMADMLAEASMGDTGEAYLINSQSLAITPSRFLDQLKAKELVKQRFELEMKLDSLGAKQGLAGETGINTYTNYLGTQVLGAYAPLKSLGWAILVEQDTREAFASTRNLQDTVLGIVLILAVLIILISIFVTRSLARPILAVTQAALRLADGDSEQTIEVKSKDEIGAIAEAFQKIAAYQGEMAQAAQRLAAGDLTVTMTPKSEKDRLGQSFAQMINIWRELVSDLSGNSKNLLLASEQLVHAAAQAGQATGQIAMTIQQVARGTSQQTESITQTAASVEQMTQAIDGVARGAGEQSQAVTHVADITTQLSTAIQQVSSNALAGAKGSEQAAQVAQGGAQTVAKTIQGMQAIQSKVALSAQKVQEMGQRSQQIEVMVDTIEDIASQTNLLALNAAIEAARAGEHGKGFAVVADEVRKLAEKSAGATKEIGSLVKDIQHTVDDAVAAMQEGSTEVEKGVTQANQAGQALEEILRAAQEVNRQVAGIAAAAQQMGNLSNELVSATDSVSAVVEENTAATEEMSKGSAEMSRAIENIASVSEENSAAVEEVSASTEEMSAQVEEVTASAQNLAAMADLLQEVVAQFKTSEQSLSQKAPEAVKPGEFQALSRPASNGKNGNGRAVRQN
jgi:methyl-accepting chemotaxis protein